MKRNIIGNFTLNFTTPHEHHLVIEERHLNENSQQELLVILSALLPNKPYASIEEMDPETEVYESITIRGHTINWFDSNNIDLVRQ